MFGKRFSRALVVTTTASLVMAAAAFASDWEVAVVDVTAPTAAVTLAPGGSGNIDIDISVTGNQAGTATFKVYRDWTLSGGTFTGSNPQQFTVDPRSGGDLATTFSTTGTVSVAAGHADGGPFTLAVGAFDITNTNTTGAKLENGTASSYSVTVEAPAAPGDTTAPNITITTPAHEAVYTLGQVVIADYECTDDESAVTQCEGDVASGSAIDTGTVGAKTFTVNAASEGGTSFLTHDYSVVFAWDGFFSPVENLPAWNLAKAGQSIPVKFSLGGDQGLNIFTSDAPYNGTPRIVQVACPSASTTPDPIEEYATTTANSKLNYDALTGQYNYVWKTDKAWAGKCFRLDVKLIDGTTHSANFKFTK